MDLANKRIVVTGGSRGLGVGLVEALVESGGLVTVVARASDALEAVRERLGVAVRPADICDEAAAHDILAQVDPDAVILNAGMKMPMARLDKITWAEFSAPWEHDVKAGLHWLQAALNTPLRPGSRVVVVSSGAAVAGSPMSGGYGGAKRMLWFMARYANRVAQQRDLGIRFQTVVPRQMVLGTGIGDTAAGAYAQAQGITPEAFVARFGAAMPPRLYGDHVVAVLEDRPGDDGFAFALTGDRGVEIMERMSD
jgi:NAD(P)-dependent dehydrogenase (short-subunit alcohol dehydrogenase family)